MEIKINIERILIYYDVVQLFVGVDNINARYLCMLYEDENGENYLAVRISSSQLSMLLSGNIDLKNAYTTPECSNEYFRFTINDETTFIGSYIETIHDYMLPEDGIILHPQHNDTLIIEEQVTYNKPIIHFGLVDDNNSHNIRVASLSTILDSYQSFVSQGHKKLHKKSKPIDSELKIFNTSAASFNIHMYVDTNLDLFGRSDIEETLRFIDNIFSFESEDDLTHCLSAIKGNAISNLKTMFNDLINNRMSIKYKWATPNIESSICSRIVPLDRIKLVYDIITRTNDLDSENITYSGCFLKVDIMNGDWKFYDNESDSMIKGKCDTPDKLSGITVQTTSYTIICIVKTEKQNITEKLIQTAFLQEIITT